MIKTNLLSYPEYEIIAPFIAPFPKASGRIVF
jgi:hypothetical protein